jgi:hypothetical protein
MEEEEGVCDGRGERSCFINRISNVYMAGTLSTVLAALGSARVSEVSVPATKPPKKQRRQGDSAGNTMHETPAMGSALSVVAV